MPDDVKAADMEAARRPDVLRELQLIRREVREIAEKARVVGRWLELVEQNVLKMEARMDSFANVQPPAERGEGQMSYCSSNCDDLLWCNANRQCKRTLQETCMCGDYMNHSPWAGHTPVSMWEYCVAGERGEEGKETGDAT